MSTNRRKQVNPVHFKTFVRCLLAVLLLASAGLFFVFIKNQQFALAEEIRQVERRNSGVRAQNEALLARVTELSSRRALQQKIAEGFIVMKPIQDNVIARLSPPAAAAADGILRTAFVERARP